MINRFSALVSFCLLTAITFAQNNTVTVGEAAMYPEKDIIANAVNSADHTTLVAAVKAADLVSTLQSEGPFTVFAPTNQAFAELPEGTVETLLKPENKDALTGVLTYHVVAGKYGYNEIAAAIRANDGMATLTTVNGGQLTAMMNGPQNIAVKDAQGNIANVAIYDVMQSNGVIHVVDQVLLP